jgi:hypothetical protein
MSLMSMTLWTLADLAGPRVARGTARAGAAVCRATPLPLKVRKPPVCRPFRNDDAMTALGHECWLG